MKTIRVSLKERSYPVYIGEGILGRLAPLIKKTRIGTDAIIITMPGLKKRFGKSLGTILRRSCRSTLFLTIPDTEKSKNAELALRLIEKITRFDNKKKCFLIALGGGVVGDLTGFIAAIYKRGIPFLQVPTTLLAQVDSSIGGKTAVDTALGKNLVGAFYQPRFVVADIAFLKTLAQPQLLAGLSETVKYGIIKDPALFAFIEKNWGNILRRDKQALEHIIARSAAIKAALVARDERDQSGIRMVLNFGHTFGHAIETSSHFRVSHGKAVSIGMACACELSVCLGLLDPEGCKRIIGLLERLGLPTRLTGIRPDAVLKAMAHDKKFSTHNRFVLVEKIGRTKIVRGVAQDILKKIIKGRTVKTTAS